MEVFIQIVLLAVGFLLLVKGADWFVEGASEFATRLGIPQIVIGLTIVAMGTSAPEAAISISAAVKGSADIAVGNVVGSNIMNVLLILGITAIITPLAVQRNTRRFEIPFVIGITAVLAFLGLSDNVVGRINGIILWGFFALYLIYLFRMSKSDMVKEKEKIEKKEVPLRPKFGKVKIIVLIALGLVMVIFGSNIAVDAASELARIAGMSEKFIGLTIVAFGTSLPELCTCIMAGLKKNADIAIGNIIGSNIFNILFVLGTSAIITNIPYQSSFFVDSIVCIATPALLLLLLLNKKVELKRFGGVIMLAAYAGYFAYLMMKSL